MAYHPQYNRDEYGDHVWIDNAKEEYLMIKGSDQNLFASV